MKSGYYRFNRANKPIPSNLTIGICVVTAIVTLLDFAGISFFSENFQLANFRLWIGEPWRLMSYSLVHGGFFHVGMNLYILWFLGLILERTVGKAAFLTVYLASVLGGGIAISLMGDVMVPTVGASGGIFGLMGALISYIYSRTGSLRGVMEVPFGRTLVILMVLNLALSFAPGISMLGHVGGLIPGLLLGYLIERHQSKRLELGEKLGALLLLVLLIGGAIYATAPTHRKEVHVLQGAKHLGLEYILISVPQGSIPYLTYTGREGIDATRLAEAKAIMAGGSKSTDSSQRWLEVKAEIDHYVKAIESILKDHDLVTQQALVDAFAKKRENIEEQISDYRGTSRSKPPADLPFGK